MFSSRNCNILAVGQCAPLPRRTIHHKIRTVISLLSPVPGRDRVPDYGGYPGRTLLKGVVPLRVLDVGVDQGY